MKLHTRIAGNGSPLVLLHGLFGSNENLGGVARALSGFFTIYGMDLRNHGRSPHADTMDYPAMAADVRDTLDTHGLRGAIFLGHSLGGKTAMELALSTPERVRGLIVVDIAPVTYDRRHDQELEALRTLNPGAINTRADADAALSDSVPDPAIRQFLLKNLSRTNKGFTWRIPLETIHSEHPNIAAAPVSVGPYDGPALFIRGGDSEYVPPEAESAIHQRFRNAEIATLDGQGHWPHVESPDLFLDTVRRFLDAQRADTVPQPLG